MREEIGAAPVALEEIGTYYTEAQGKRDTVRLCVGTLAHPAVIKTGNEIAAACWMPVRRVLGKSDVARVVKVAVTMHAARRS